MIPLFKSLSSVTRESAIYRNGIVESHLFNSISPNLPLIGIIFQQWCNWLPALTLVPLEPRWVWVLDTHWLKICKGLHPNVLMPAAVSHLRSNVVGTYMCNCDVGEIFLNFMLEPKLRRN